MVNALLRRRARPVPPWLVRVRIASFAMVAVVLPIAAAASWIQVHQDTVVQAGPRVVAQVDGFHVSSHSSRGGRVYTTRYRVRFPVDGRTVSATLRLTGDDPCACASTLVTYDPRHPQHAELVGVSNGSRTGALLLTAMALGLPVLGFGLAGMVRRTRRGSPYASPDLRALRRPAAANRVPVAVAGGLVLLAAVVVPLVARSRYVGPSTRLERHVIAAALAGQGTTDCLGLSPLPPGTTAPAPGWLLRAVTAALGAPVPPDSPGAPHTYPARSAFGSDLEPALLSLGGTGAPGLPPTAFGGWLGTSGSPGFRSIDVWSLSSPANAARFADAYLAADCYRFARHSGFPARVAAPAQPLPDARYVVLGDARAPGLVIAMGVVPVGHYVVRTLVEGLPAQQQSLTDRAAEGLRQALELAG